MQRTEDGLIIISCDFCGTDWDEVKPMIEGHHGSVLCLECVKLALVQETAEQPDETSRYSCTMCLRELPASKPHWRPPAHGPGPGAIVEPPPGLNPAAAVCHSCLNQAAVAFERDPEVEWTRPVK